MFNVAILGFGVVGCGTAEVLSANKENIKVKCGEEINIKYNQMVLHLSLCIYIINKYEDRKNIFDIRMSVHKKSVIYYHLL